MKLCEKELNKLWAAPNTDGMINLLASEIYI